MKRLILPLAVACLFAGMPEGTAQVKFALGPKFGINFASTSLDPAVQAASGRTTILFGAAFEVMFAKMFGVQLEPSYATKGYAANNIGVQTQGGVIAANITVGYKEIQFPILFKAKFLDGPVKPYAIVGPNLGIVASANVNVAPAQGAQFQAQDVDIKSSTSGMDFGIDFGGGAEFNITPRIGITGDVRYSLGLSNLDNTTPQQGQVQTSTKTRGFQIQFGALFSI
jgi:opacity protein-like surface antigen